MTPETLRLWREWTFLFLGVKEKQREKIRRKK